MPNVINETCHSVTSGENEVLWGTAAEKLAHELGIRTLAFSTNQDVLDTVMAAEELAGALPGRITDAAASFAEEGDKRDYMVVGGITPPEEMLQTLPKDRGLPVTAAVGVTKLVAVTMASLVGPPLCYSKDHPQGPRSFIALVAPDPAWRNIRSTASYTDSLWHCEVPGPRRPDFQTLFCVRGQSGVPTMIVTPDRLLPHLSELDLALLQEEDRFVTTTGFDDVDTKTPMPAIEEAQGGFRINFDNELMYVHDKEDQEAANALGRLAALLSRPGVSTQYELESGDTLFFRNGLAVHRRDKFNPDFTKTRTLFRVLSGRSQHFPDAPLVKLHPPT